MLLGGIGAAISAALIVANQVLGAIVLIAVMTFIIMLGIFYQFVLVEFTKEFDAKGLYKLTRPFLFKSALGILAALSLAFCLIYILLFIPCILIGIICGFLGIGETMIGYICGVFGGYAGFIIQLVWGYCLVQIYKERFEQSIEEEY